MECRALCGSLVGGGRRVLNGELGLQQLHNCIPSAKQGLSVQKTPLQVRAVTTDNRAFLGRRARREQNVEGEFFVDRTCIDCDTCRWMAPTVFSRIGDKSAVHHQPTSEDERLEALQALLACPTASIRTVHPPKDIIEAHNSFPLPIDPSLPVVYHCGYHSERSFAATSYFITRSEGNILVDSPRFSEPLAKQFDELGGVRYMFLTHKDDVADHQKWRARFGCERILHKDEVTSGTRDVEWKLEGKGNWNIGSDVELIFTPGHTEAHVVLFLKERGVMFTGDHLSNSLRIDKVHNWYSVSQQVDSIEALISYDFTWMLPGHGRRHKFQSVQEKNDILKEVVAHERRFL
ncbi:unnamed protein product [Calypogeia fissa]